MTYEGRLGYKLEHIAGGTVSIRNAFSCKKEEVQMMVD